MNILTNGFEPISLKRLASLNPYVSLPKSGSVDYVPMENIHQGYLDHQTEEISSLPSSLNAFSEGDILLAKVTPCFENGNIAIASNLLTGVGLCSTELFVLRIHSDKILPEYLMLLLQDDQFKKEAKSYMRGTGGLKRIPTDWLMSRKFLIPSLKHQRLIIQAMSSSDSPIQDIQKGFRETLDRLSSYRQSLITRAVTKGLDPNVEMKDSGVEWIGSIPREWKTSKISFVSDVTLGKMLCPRQTDSEQTLETYLCAGSISWDGVKDYIKEMWFSSKEKSELLLIAGDVLIVEGGAGFGMTTLYKGEHSPCYFQNSIIRVRGHHNVMTSDFINYWMRFTYTAYLKTVCNEATFSHYTKEKVSETPILVPPLNEQKKIADFCKLVDERVKTICAGIENQISKLNEYRSSLISAAVTGQLAIDEEVSA